MLEVKGFLSDGSYVHFKDLTQGEFDAKCQGPSLENKLYQFTKNVLADKANADEIRK